MHVETPYFGNLYSCHRTFTVHTDSFSFFSTHADLYFTRVTPSKQLDLLAVDFDYTLISAVVIGMAVSTYVLSKVATRKMLKSQWK